MHIITIITPLVQKVMVVLAEERMVLRGIETQLDCMKVLQVCKVVEQDLDLAEKQFLHQGI